MGCWESKGVHMTDAAYLRESHFPTSPALGDREPLIGDPSPRLSTTLMCDPRMKM